MHPPVALIQPLPLQLSSGLSPTASSASSFLSHNAHRNVSVSQRPPRRQAPTAAVRTRPRSRSHSRSRSRSRPTPHQPGPSSLGPSSLGLPTTKSMLPGLPGLPMIVGYPTIAPTPQLPARPSRIIRPSSLPTVSLPTTLPAPSHAPSHAPTHPQTKSPAYKYNLQLRALARKKDSLSSCLRIVAHMRSCEVVPDKYTYSLLLTSCIRCKAHETASEIYHQIRKDGIPIDLHLRSSLLKIAASAPKPQIDLCLRLFRGVQKPNRIMCNVMMDAYANVAQVEGCISVYRYMIGAGITPDGYTVSALVKAYIRANRPDDALTDLHEMHSAGIQLPSPAFAQLIFSYGRQHNLDAAIRVYDLMTAWHIQPTQITYNVLIGACAHVGDIVQAEEIFEEMRHTSLFAGDRYTYHELIKCCLRRGDGRTALQWYHRISQTPFQYNMVSFRLALTAAAQILDMDSVQLIAQRLHYTYISRTKEISAYLVAACIRCSDLEAATHYFREYAQKADSDSAIEAFGDCTKQALRSFEDHIGAELNNNPDYERTSQVVDEMKTSWIHVQNNHPQDRIAGYLYF